MMMVVVMLSVVGSEKLGAEIGASLLLMLVLLVLLVLILWWR